MIINDLKFTDVTYINKYLVKSKIVKETLHTMLHHDSKELHDNLRAGPDENLAFSSLFGIVDALQSVGQNVHANHLDGNLSENFRTVRRYS